MAGFPANGLCSDPMNQNGNDSRSPLQASSGLVVGPGAHGASYPLSCQLGGVAGCELHAAGDQRGLVPLQRDYSEGPYALTSNPNGVASSSPGLSRSGTTLGRSSPTHYPNGVAPHPNNHQPTCQRSWPAWIRTMNNGSKGRCVTVTPRASFEARLLLPARCEQIVCGRRTCRATGDSGDCRAPSLR